MEAIDRFTNKYEVEENGCWIWKASVKNGYGLFSYNGKRVKAHRWSYSYHKRTPSEGKFICHKCDNPLCVNPEHLFQGTHKRNMEDASNKNRIKNKVLTEEQKEYILDSTESNCAIAKKFGVWESTIRRFKRNSNND